MDFLLLALCLFASFMVPSEQTDHPPQRANDGNHDRPAGRGRPPRLSRGASWNDEMHANLVRLYRSSRPNEPGHIDRFHTRWVRQYPWLSDIPALTLLRRARRLIDREVVEMRNEEHQPEIIWNPGLESQLLELYRHDPEINRVPIRLYRRWCQLHPALPDIGPGQLYNKVLQLHNHPANQAGRQHQEPEIISTTDSAPGTPNSETGSEIAWDDFHTALSRLRGESGYESDGAESSGSIPPYPESPRGPR